MVKTSPHTLTAAGFYLRYLLDVLAGLGMDLADEAAASGVDLGRLTDPAQRVSLDLVDQVLALALQRPIALQPAGQTGLPLSLQLGAAVTPVALDVLAYASMSSRTLGDAISLLCQFEPYRLGFARCVLEPHETATRVTLQTEGHWPTLPLQVEAALAGWVGFGRWITGPVAHPVCIEFAHAASAPVSEYEHFFHCPVLFERPRNAVHIQTTMLSHALAASNPDVCRLMREEMQRRIDRFAKGDQFIVRLACAIEDGLIDGSPTLEQVAATLSLETRQLRSQISAAGSTFMTEVDAVRQRLARQYLTGGMAMADISQRLGYSEQSAFTRACVRWFGVSPGQWRPKGPPTAGPPTALKRSF